MAIIKRAKASIKGLTEDLTTITEAIALEKQTRETQIGSLEDLTTLEKSSLVLAINEAAEAAGSATGALMADQNLADLDDKAAARINLEVMSSDEVNSAINTAKLALGKNYNVADIAARDALTDLTVNDRVFVADDGDAKWAIYVPTSVDPVTWAKIADQDSLENSISSPAIKAAYESQPDTNVFDDAAKTALANAVLIDTLVQTIEDEGSAEEVPSTAAVKKYVDESVGSVDAASKVLLESCVVTGNKITLTHAPKDGVSGVLNYATVRYTDVDGISYDAPVVATGVEEEFTISTDSANEWDGFTVQVQYLHDVV